jgi:hypothetical protein
MLHQCWRWLIGAEAILHLLGVREGRSIPPFLPEQMSSVAVDGT